MSFGLNKQVDKLTFKVLAANVIDSNPNSRWYESRFPANPAILAERVLNQFDLIKQYPAKDLTEAKNNVNLINSLSTTGPVIEDLSLEINATRLTRAIPARKETWVVYNNYNDPNTGFKDLWIQPQRIPRTDIVAPGSPSQGYAVRIWIGNPTGFSTELTTTMGSNTDEVGWVFNYDMGVLLFSVEMVAFLDSNYPNWETIGLWINGFRYIGSVGGLGSSIISDESGNFHALGKVKTNSTLRLGDENFKSSHNIRSREVWIDDIPYAGSTIIAYQNANNHETIRQIGTLSNPLYLYPLSDSNYRTWFFDTGTPSYFDGGFYPSENWVKNLISPVDVPNDYYVSPSFGYELQLYSRNGTFITYSTAFYDVDYFSGFIFFQEDRTPIDSNNGLGFIFDNVSFEGVTDKISYLKNTSTGGPRAIAFQYVGRFLSDIQYGNGLTYSNGKLSIDIATQSGLTFSLDGQISVSIDDSTLKIDNSGRIYVNGDSVYQVNNPLQTSGDNSPTGITIQSTPIGYSSVKVFINGQIQIIGDASINSDCYFFDGTNPVNLEQISVGNELYWNGDISGYDLNPFDIVLILYEQ
jgi:hypothetical protein